MWRIPGLFSATSTGEGYVLGLDLEGKVIHTLQDVTGETYPDTTSVIEYKGSLCVGSVSADGVGRIRIPGDLNPRAMNVRPLGIIAQRAAAADERRGAKYRFGRSVIAARG